MINPFARSEKNLGRAGLLFFLAILSSIGLSFVLTGIGYEPSVAVLLVGAAMPFVAWFTSKAASAQGKSPWLYGVASLLPPLGIFLFFSLYNRDALIRVDAAACRHDA